MDEEIAELQNYWDSKLAHAAREPLPLIEMSAAQTKLSEESEAVLFNSKQHGYYLVKPAQARRRLIADRVVSMVGSFMGAPVPEVDLVIVPDELIDTPGSACAHFEKAIAHGSRWIDGVRQEREVKHLDQPGNVQRFASIAVLWGLTFASDEQFLYRSVPPHLVYSHDHGRFLPVLGRSFNSDVWPLEPSWTVKSLVQRLSEPPSLSRYILSRAPCRKEHLVAALERLRAITDDTIAVIVQSVPEEWGITPIERVVLSMYLSMMRDKMYESFVIGNAV